MSRMRKEGFIAGLLAVLLGLSSMQVNAEIPGAEPGQPEEAAVKESVEAPPDMGMAEGENVYIIETGWQCNPLYDGLISVPGNAEGIAAYSAGDILSTKEEAAAYMNEKLIAREGSIAFTYITYAQDVQEELGELWDMALDWNGDTNPQSGDYLRFHFGKQNLSVSYSISSSGRKVCNVAYTVTYNSDVRQEEDINSRIPQVLQQLNLTGKTSFEKVQAIYDYICGNVEYDFDNLDDTAYVRKFSAYAALVDRKAVCQGYALLFYRLCREAGIDAKIIAGTGNGGSHAWNIVRLGTKYFNVDSTWDASRRQNGVPYEYFLKSEADFTGHERQEPYNTADFCTKYPMTELSYGNGGEVSDPEPTATPTSEPAVTPKPEKSVAAPDFQVVGTIGGRNVTFRSDTKDAVIYYSAKSSSLTTADNSVQNGNTVLFEDFYGSVYARAYSNGKWSNVSRLILKIPVVNTPEIIQTGGKVTIKTTTPNSIIYYTTDGSTPSPDNGIRVNASICNISVSKGTTIQAIAVRSCFTNSKVASAKAAISAGGTVGAPAFNVKGVIGGRTVTFTSNTQGSTIYYSATTSSVTTRDKSVKSGGSVTFDNFYGTVYARAYKDGQWSNVSRLILKIPVVNTPAISRSGNYVTIKTTTPGCTIYYTTNGTVPSPANGIKLNASSGRVKVEAGKTVKAIAVRSCFGNSSVATSK